MRSQQENQSKNKFLRHLLCPCGDGRLSRPAERSSAALHTRSMPWGEQKANILLSNNPAGPQVPYSRTLRKRWVTGRQAVIGKMAEFRQLPSAITLNSDFSREME
ncbi:MAG: hypothetical protein ABSF85_07390 [Terriglobales bacterium]|jgi:hypothetical protein